MKVKELSSSQLNKNYTVRISTFHYSWGRLQTCTTSLSLPTKDFDWYTLIPRKQMLDTHMSIT